MQLYESNQMNPVNLCGIYNRLLFIALKGQKFSKSDMDAAH